MPKLDPHHLTRARQVDLIAYLSAHGHQPVYHRRHKALFHSPLREDRHPSFSVRYADGAWKWCDFGTGDHGDGIDLVMQLKQVDFQSAVRLLVGEGVPNSPDAERQRGSYPPGEIRRLYR